MKTFWGILGALAAIGAGAFVGGIGYFEFAPPEKTCASCHEIRPSLDHWLMSVHRQTDCHACHGSSIGSLGDNAKRVWRHATEKRHDDIRLSEAQILRMSEACGACHAREYANWKASGHGSGYARFFEDARHNAAYKPADDCLRCHGMFYEGEMRDLVGEVYAPGKMIASTSPAFGGQWKLREPGRGAMSAIPCLACHSMHAAGAPYRRVTNAVAFAEARSTNGLTRAERLLAARTTDLYWRGARRHLPTDNLCLQCHAPDASGKPGTADDRTPTGVHAGLSCVACHKGHSLSTYESCRDCHSAPGVCKRDVAAMDTTYRSKTSRHDIHHLTCTSCHAARERRTGN